MVQSNTCIGSCHFAAALPLGSPSRRTTPALIPGGRASLQHGDSGERQVQGRSTSHQLPAYITKRAPTWTPYKVLEAKPGFEPGVKALQASALPLGHFADMQRAEKGIGPQASNGADNGARTRDPNLGKVVLYQLSHVRLRESNIRDSWGRCKRNLKKICAAAKMMTVCR